MNKIMCKGDKTRYFRIVLCNTFRLLHPRNQSINAGRIESTHLIRVEDYPPSGTTWTKPDTRPTVD